MDRSDYPTTIETKRRLAEEEYWHYQHDLGDGVLTKPWNDWLIGWHQLRRGIIFDRLAPYFGDSLEGMTCLDVACNSGFWSFEMADRGAASVLAFDESCYMVNEAEYIRRCRPDRPSYDRITFRTASYYDIELPENQFDLVLGLGMMYHLSDILGVAQRLYRATRRVALFDSSVSDLPGNVLEISDNKKYFWCTPEEFSFVPTRSALRMILEKAGFSKVTPWMPDPSHPGYKEFGPEGFRHIIVCEK